MHPGIYPCRRERHWEHPPRGPHIAPPEGSRGCGAREGSAVYAVGSSDKLSSSSGSVRGLAVLVDSLGGSFLLSCFRTEMAELGGFSAERSGPRANQRTSPVESDTDHYQSILDKPPPSAQPHRATGTSAAAPSNGH
ncbi:hypothetical protein CYMTET_50196 [Cymbomonas tetramitiformis]|uniref:Uncharacterized protein n=1 Tax=Cymbomonas tetramitiformis TaxID=36881 RepID=A0AAE0BNQ1_9CHLO|nr:hypothetical protein CYMTET_50196 [Cymbomonas tetramitiformis]